MKVGAEPWVFKHLLARLEREFGKLTVTMHEFTNTGVHHKQHSDGSITLDQHDYINAIRPIRDAELQRAAPDKLVSERLRSFYMSLLGVVAYCLLTLHWVSVYVTSLQRVASKPQVQHIRKLNKVVAALKHKKAEVRYAAMICLSQLLVPSDSALKRDTDK